MKRQAQCHPDRFEMARGLCSACYQRQRRGKPLDAPVDRRRLSIADRQAAKATSPRHVIASIKYARNADPGDAPIVCTCGWAGLGRDYQAHRVQNGQTYRFPGGQPSRGDSERPFDNGLR